VGALRTGLIARDCDELRPFVRRLDLNYMMSLGASIFLEIPQGYGLSVQSQFYPYTTSRDCSVPRGLADADIHPSFHHQTFLVVRTFPIRVGAITDAAGNVLGSSGDCYADQSETTWNKLGVEPEITTVTKRVRRVFTWSFTQVQSAFIACRPSVVLLTHTDYVQHDDLQAYVLSLLLAAKSARIDRPRIFRSDGPTTADVTEIREADIK
jgi:adenylosuccinate synthase